MISGSLELLWPDAAALEAALDSVEGQDEFLLGGLALAPGRRGVVLATNQVFDFAPPPVLGGPFDVANVTAMDFVVAVNISGQIHQQILDLPSGTKIGRITVDSVPPLRRSKFWRRKS